MSSGSAHTLVPGAASTSLPRPARGILWHVARFARHKPLGMAGAVMIGVFVVLAVAGPLLAPFNPYALRPEHVLEAPNATFILGTDDLGRDQLSRIIYGTRASLYVGVLGALAGSMLGGVIGLITAFKGGVADSVAQRVMDVLMSFPLLVLALAMVAALGPSLLNAAIAVSIPFIPRSARTIRSRALSVKEAMYIESTRAVGCSDGRIILYHMLPNCLAPWLVICTVQIASGVLVEASLSFLGLGVPPPEPSWGNMLVGWATKYVQAAPWTAIYPGLVITVSVYSFSLLGDALRDVLDPRMRTDR